MKHLRFLLIAILQTAVLVAAADAATSNRVTDVDESPAASPRVDRNVQPSIRASESGHEFALSPSAKVVVAGGVVRLNIAVTRVETLRISQRFASPLQSLQAECTRLQI
jgi:hypothetical protein